MFYLGIDIGKRTHVASVINEEGKIVLSQILWMVLALY